MAISNQRGRQCNTLGRFRRSMLARCQMATDTHRHIHIRTQAPRLWKQQPVCRTHVYIHINTRPYRCGDALVLLEDSATTHAQASECRQANMLRSGTYGVVSMSLETGSLGPTFASQADSTISWVAAVRSPRVCLCCFHSDSPACCPPCCG